jgi:hypothetical protein
MSPQIRLERDVVGVTKRKPGEAITGLNRADLDIECLLSHA